MQDFEKLGAFYVGKKVDDDGELTDEIVLYDSENRQLLVLNEFAAGVWLLIDGQRTIDDLKQAVVDCVGADPETVAEDVATFVQQLVERNIVRWRTT